MDQTIRPRRRHRSTIALAALILACGVAALLLSYACSHVIGTHNGTYFDRGILLSRGRIVLVTTLAPAPFNFRAIAAERLDPAEIDSIVSRLATMTTSSGGIAGLRWMSDPSRSPGFSGVGHRTLMLSGWMALLLSVAAAIAIAWLDPVGRLKRLRRNRGFEVVSSSGGT